VLDPELETLEQEYRAHRKRLKEEQRRGSTTTDPMVEWWLERTRGSRYRGPDSSGYRRAVQLLNDLRRARQCRWHWSQEWLRKRGIPERLLRKRFTEEDLLRGLSQLLLMQQPGYEPRGKEKFLRLQLHQLLYSEQSGMSWFLSAYYNGAPRTQWVLWEERLKRSPYGGLVQKACRVLGIGEERLEERVKVLDALESIVDFYLWLPGRCGEKLSSYWVGTGETGLAEHFIQCALVDAPEEERQWHRELGAAALRPTGPVFRHYLDRYWPEQPRGVPGALHQLGAPLSRYLDRYLRQLQESGEERLVLGRRKRKR